MEDKVVAEIYSQDQKKRVRIFVRESGTYYYEQDYFSEDEYEMCWVPLRQNPIGHYESQDIAAREAQGNIDWLVTEAKQDAV
jgi:hypothetical protein